MDKKKWDTANMVGFLGIVFLLVAATRTGSNPAPAAQPPAQQIATTAQNQPAASVATSTGITFDPRSATYRIEGMDVTITNGVGEMSAAPGSASKVITKYFGNGALGDLNGDGMSDMAFLLTQESGGSGLFYYAVVALRVKNSGAIGSADSAAIGMADEYRITNTVLIGDRIAPQPSEIRGGKFYVHYADRNLGEPMTAPATVGKTKVLDVNGQGVLAE